MGGGGHGVGAPPPPNIGLGPSTRETAALRLKVEQMPNNTNVAVAMRSFMALPPFSGQYLLMSNGSQCYNFQNGANRPATTKFYKMLAFSATVTPWRMLWIPKLGGLIEVVEKQARSRGLELGKTKRKRLLRLACAIDDHTMPGTGIESSDFHTLGLGPGLDRPLVNLEREFARAAETRCAPFGRRGGAGGNTEPAAIRLRARMQRKNKRQDQQQNWRKHRNGSMFHQHNFFP